MGLKKEEVCVLLLSRMLRESTQDVGSYSGGSVPLSTSIESIFLLPRSGPMINPNISPQHPALFLSFVPQGFSLIGERHDFLTAIEKKFTHFSCVHTSIKLFR